MPEDNNNYPLQDAKAQENVGAKRSFVMPGVIPEVDEQEGFPLSLNLCFSPCTVNVQGGCCCWLALWGGLMGTSGPPPPANHTHGDFLGTATLTLFLCTLSCTSA